MKRVLVANRGEIALRVIRACREEGLETVAVFSSVDRASPHVQAADRAVELGEAPASSSYLDIAKVLAAARSTEADAIHPGYGFLAERAEFAEAVEAEGLTFIGPTAHAIRAMGEKTEARRRMRDAGVPIVPGTVAPVRDAEQAVRAAAEIGYPVLLKAAAGGGGKGMRIARSESEVRSSFAQAASEATKAFGNGDIYVERVIEHPRHVEIQVLGDRHGRVVHLGERECSVQRRHQKLIEESPSPALNSELRTAMGNAAVRAAESVEYIGAGTVEFLLDPSGTFHFLEMNTRIQVEHPVTEMVYGIDLVREQLRIARGDRLAVPEGALHPRGHAIECRISSEDPYNLFLPATGQVTAFRVPGGPGVRWDGGIGVGSEVGLYYDSLLGKLVTWGESRDAAISRMRRALSELLIVGVATTQPFHIRVMADDTFVSGSYDIGYLEAHGDRLMSGAVPEEWIRDIAVATALAEHRVRRSPVRASQSSTPTVGESTWAQVARLEALR